MCVRHEEMVANSKVALVDVQTLQIKEEKYWIVLWSKASQKKEKKVRMSFVRMAEKGIDVITNLPRGPTTSKPELIECEGKSSADGLITHSRLLDTYMGEPSLKHRDSIQPCEEGSEALAHSQ